MILSCMLALLKWIMPVDVDCVGCSGKWKMGLVLRGDIYLHLYI